MKTRALQTKVWRDDWFTSLDAISKLAFIYLLTNDYINLCGIYELSDRIICFETGINPKQLEAVKEKMTPKITFYKGYISINNIEKYDDYKGGLLIKAKEKQLSEIPEKIISELRNRVSIPYARGIDTSNSNSNSNSKLVVEGKLEKTVEYLKEFSIEDFKDIDASEKNIRLEAEKAGNWLLANNTKKSNYKAFLRNWVLRTYKKKFVPIIAEQITEDRFTIDEKGIARVQAMKEEFKLN